MPRNTLLTPPDMSAPSSTRSVRRGRIVGGIVGATGGLIAGYALAIVWFYLGIFIIAIAGIVGGFVGIMVGMGRAADRAENDLGSVILGGIFGGFVDIVGGVFFPLLVVVGGIVVGARLGKSIGGIIGRWWLPACRGRSH